MDVILIAGLWLHGLGLGRRRRRARTSADIGSRLLPASTNGRRVGDARRPARRRASPPWTHADRPIVGGHSARPSTLAWMVADRRPDDVAGVVMVGGFPAKNGSRYADFFEIVEGVMPFPGWEPFDGPDSADLDAAAPSGSRRRRCPCRKASARQ